MDFFKVLLGLNPKPASQPKETVVVETVETLKPIEQKPPQSPKNIEVKEKSQIPKPQNIIKKVTKPVIIEEPKEQNMAAEIFLVVIDTNGRPECTNFPQAIQNFYFIYANDEETAKGIVLHTFRSRQALLAQLQYATKATRLSSIVKSIGPGHNFWTYVPFGRQRSPGQQAIIPNPEALLKPDEYGNPSSKQYTPQAPTGGEEITADDLKGVQFNPADGKVMNKLRSNGQPVAPIDEEMPPVSPEVAALNAQMAQMQAMMTQLVQAQQANQRPARSSRKKASPTTPEPPVDGEATP